MAILFLIINKRGEYRKERLDEKNMEKYYDRCHYGDDAITNHCYGRR